MRLPVFQAQNRTCQSGVDLLQPGADVGEHRHTAAHSISVPAQTAHLSQNTPDCPYSTDYSLCNNSLMGSYSSF